MPWDRHSTENPKMSCVYAASNQSIQHISEAALLRTAGFNEQIQRNNKKVNKKPKVKNIPNIPKPFWSIYLLFFQRRWVLKHHHGEDFRLHSPNELMP